MNTINAMTLVKTEYQISSLRIEGSEIEGTERSEIYLRLDQPKHFFSSDRSVVKFSAMAFIDPANYIEVAENATAVREYVRELRSFLYLHKAGDKFDVNKIMTAVLTSRADEAWLSRENQDKYLRKFVRRYIGTYNGVLRLFPGAPLPPNFDHTTRSW